MKNFKSLLVASLAMMSAATAFAQEPVYTKTNVTGYPVEVPAQYTASFLASKATTTVVEFTKNSDGKSALVASTDGGNYFYANISLADNRLGFDYIMDNGLEGWFTKTMSPYTDLETTVRVAFTQNEETGLLNLYDAETGAVINSTNVSSNSAWGARSFGTKGCNHVYIGGYVDGNGNAQYVFPGTIASVRLFDTQLTPAQLTALSWDNLQDTGAAVVPEYNTTAKFFTAQELRAEVAATGKALIGLAGVTTTANKYINGKAFNGTLLSEAETLAGVRAPQADEILEVLPVEGGYVLRQADAAEGEGYLVCDAGGNFTTTDVAAANVWSILSPSEEGYGTISGWADLFTDVEASMSNENLVRFIAKGQYLNGQNRDGVGGLRAGLGAWSFNYVYNANYEVEEEEPVVPVVDPAEEAYNAWSVLVTTDMKAVKDEWGTAPEADVVGKKPAAVVAAVINYYNASSWLFSSFSGFGTDWEAAKAYYENYGTTIEAKYAEALAIWEAYEAAEVVAEIVPEYVEPVLKAEDVSAEVAYYIYTEARGGLTVVDAAATGIVGTAEAGVGQDVDPTDPRQQFAFVNWEGNLYLYNVATQKFFTGKNGGHGEFTDKPVDPILFKNEGNGSVMLYFDESHNINLGGSKQVTIDGWKQKDPGNSFIIKVAEPFDQTPILEFLAYHEWNGNIAFTEAPSDIDELLDFDLEFEEARTVEAAPYGVLGAIFDETGDAYAVVLGERFVAEPLTADEGKVTVHFTKIADIAAELQPAAAQVAKRALGLGGSAAAKAKVVICGKSFLVDGENVYTDVIVKNYELDGTSGAIQTGIETLSTTADAVIYDLTGRRVSRVQNGVVIANGKKIVK